MKTVLRALRQYQLPCAYAVVVVCLLNCFPKSCEAKLDTSGIGIDQKLGGQIPLDLQFVDQDGKEVRLKDFYKDKPVVIMPVFFRCPMLCGLEMNAFVRCLRGLEMSTKMRAGKDFIVLTYSIDHREVPSLAKQKRTQYLAQYDSPESNDGWQFLTGQEDAIAALNEAIGFRAQYDEIGGQYAHAAGFAVTSPTGLISRYLLGIEFAPKDFRLAVIESSEGKIGSLSDHILLFCFRYDPTEGKYGLAILRILKAGGVLTVLIIGTAITLMLRRERAVAKSRQLMEGTSNG